MDYYHNLLTGLSAFSLYGVASDFLKYASDYITLLLKPFDFSLTIGLKILSTL